MKQVSVRKMFRKSSKKRTSTKSKSFVIVTANGFYRYRLDPNLMIAVNAGNRVYPGGRFTTRDEIRRALKGVSSELPVYRNGEQGRSCFTVINNNSLGGVSFGCQRFDRTATATIRRWATDNRVYSGGRFTTRDEIRRALTVHDDRLLPFIR